MKALDRAVAVLEVVVATERGATVTEAAARAGLPLTTAHRLLNGLVDSGLLVRDPFANRYQPGSRLMRLAARVNASRRQDEELDVELDGLRQRWQESVYAAALVDGQVVCIRSLTNAGPNRADIGVPVGRMMPTHSSAAARALLSVRPEDEAVALFRDTDRERYTPHTLVGIRALRDELRATRSRGYALCDQEMEVGVVAVAVPVPSLPGRVPVCVGAIGVQQRMEQVIADGLITDLQEAAARLADHEMPISAEGVTDE